MRAPPPRLARLAADVGVPALVGLYLVATVAGTHAGRPGWLRLLALAAAVGQGVALRWRRTRPAAVLAAAVAGGAVVQAAAPDGIFPVAALVALWSLASAGPPRRSVPGAAAVLALTAANFWTATAGDAAFACAFPVVVWALAEAVRNRRVAIDQAARRAAGEEQARIAREVHDVIAHSVSVIVVQAAAADDVFDASPGQARAALRSIEAAGREALGELRSLLSSVRPDGAPGLRRLDELADTVRAAGLDVTVECRSPALRADLDLAAYRIVQEALTNTLRHAGARTARVTVRADGDHLELEVLDDGCAAAGGAAGAGRGIAGMRERAATVGGRLSAAPVGNGGFRVYATLPLAP